LYGSIVEEESGKTVFKNSIPTDMSSELAIDDSEAILYVRVLSDDIIKVDGDRHAYLLDKNFNIIYCHYNIGKFPWGAILNGNYYYINDINEIVKVNLTTFESKSIASNGKAFMADNDENFIYYSNEFSELYKLSPEDEIAVMALRGGDIVGRHTVGLYNDGEFLELNHTATARNTFSKGAIKVAKWIVGKDARLYSINDALGL
jgi:hypothetical protein